MTIHAYALLIFATGVLAGIALALLADAAHQQVQIIRYLRQRRIRTIKAN